MSAKLKHHLYIATKVGFPDTKAQYSVAVREYKEVVEEMSLSADYGKIYSPIVLSKLLSGYSYSCSFT